MGWTRRDALRAFAVVPVAFVARPAAAASPRRANATAVAPGGAPSAFRDLVPGLTVGSCTLVEVGAIERGGVPIVLRAQGGDTFRVDALRHDAATPGICRAGSLGLYLINQGTGSTQTNEEHGLGVMALGRLLEEREARGGAVPQLLTLQERIALPARSPGRR
jgi:hypothetical protein